jgi:hypothetical protein
MLGVAERFEQLSSTLTDKPLPRVPGLHNFLSRCDRSLPILFHKLERRTGLHPHGVYLGNQKVVNGPSLGVYALGIIDLLRYEQSCVVIFGLNQFLTEFFLKLSPSIWVFSQ